MTFTSRNRDKAIVEEAWIKYAPVWATAAAVVMITGLAEEVMGDIGLLVFASVLASGVVGAPLLLARSRGVKLGNGSLEAMVLSNIVLSFGLNYFQTPFFFDVLHMRYGFQVSLRIDRNPVFLYLLTMPYFATLTAVASFGCRYLARAWRPSFAALGFLTFPFILAFVETVSHATPVTAKIFCYDDLELALGFGSLCYGIAFLLALPVWMHQGVSEHKGVCVPTFWAPALMAGVVIVDALLLAFIRHFVAPSFTTVVPDSSPFGGCLAQ